MKDKADSNMLAREVCGEYKLGDAAVSRVATHIAYLDASRFKTAYANGRPLALQRANGMRLRHATSGPEVDVRVVGAMDAETCSHAWMLEIADRCGVDNTMLAIYEAMATDNALIDVGQFPPRIEPIADADMLFLLRQCAVTLFFSLTGVKPSRKRDFTHKNNRIVAVPGRPAAFTRSLLGKAGWSYVDGEIAQTYFFAPMKKGEY